ncbi:MAG: UDP-N-acetylmuramate dehydrogenase [Bacteroidetes bacterium]|nr:UDP-N-acetylmuramate dehydrogenase [Bacteroidota bacterium]
MSVLQQNHPLREHNSFRVDVHSSLFAKPSTAGELQEVLKSYDYRNRPLLVIGEGSNILFTKDFDGLILKPDMKGIDILEENESEVVVRVGAGENWDSWVKLATSQGWFGLENLSLIPGSVGSAPVQNIGAYGVELKDHFEWLEAWDMEKEKTVTLDREMCNFDYRYSTFKGESRDRYIIIAVCFRLSKIPAMKLDYEQIGEAFKTAGGSSPADLREVIIDVRNQKLPDPDEIGNAGSFFKNPVVDRTIFVCIRVDHKDIPHYHEPNNMVKIPAAWLIEKSGWKGKRIGDVGTWPTQALVIVNHGGATGTDIYDFSQQIVDDVEKIFEITLEREVNVV